MSTISHTGSARETRTTTARNTTLLTYIGKRGPSFGVSQQHFLLHGKKYAWNDRCSHAELPDFIWGLLLLVFLHLFFAEHQPDDEDDEEDSKGDADHSSGHHPHSPHVCKTKSRCGNTSRGPACFDRSRTAARSAGEESPPLTVHLDLHCAAFFPHIIAGCAFVDSGTVLGQIPQRHNLRVFQI